MSSGQVNKVVAFLFGATQDGLHQELSDPVRRIAEGECVARDDDGGLGLRKQVNSTITTSG